MAHWIGHLLSPRHKKILTNCPDGEVSPNPRTFTWRTLHMLWPLPLFLLPSPQLCDSVTPLAWDCPTFPRKRCMAGVGTLCIQPSLPTPDLLSLCPLPQCRLQPIWRELCRVPSSQLSPLLPCGEPLMHCLREGHSKGNCALLQCIYLLFS